MTRYRNTRAHFQRADGSVWGRDEVFEPTPAELAQYSYKLRVEPEEGESAKAEPAKAAVAPLEAAPVAQDAAAPAEELRPRHETGRDRRRHV